MIHPVPNPAAMLGPGRCNPQVHQGDIAGPFGELSEGGGNPPTGLPRRGETLVFKTGKS